MKKLFTTILAVVLIGTMSMAQTRKITTPLTPKAHSLMQMRPSMLQPSAKASVTINSFPYLNTFDNGQLGGWKSVDVDNDGKSWSSTYLLNEGAGNNGSAGFVSSASFSLETQMALTPDNWLISPAIEVPAGSHMQLSWYAAAQDPAYAEDHYSVYVSTDSLVTSFSTQVYGETLHSDVYAKHSVSLTAYAGQTIFVAFRHHNSTDQFVVKIDDIMISEPGAPEVRLTMPETAFVGDTVQLMAQLLDGDLNGLTYAWTVDGASVSATNVETVSAVWSQAGQYNVRVVTSNNLGADTVEGSIRVIDCGTVTEYPYHEGFEDGLGCWRSEDADGDGHGWFAANADAHTGSGVAASESYSGDTYEALTPNNWLKSPALQIPSDGALELSWWVKPTNVSYAAEHYSVYASLAEDETIIDTLWSETLNGGMTDFEHRVVSLAGYAGQTVQVAFVHHDCTDQLSLQIDDVEVRAQGAPEVHIAGPAKVRNIDEVTFTAVAVTSSPIATYQWTIAGGTPSTASTEQVTVTFADSGLYQVQVIVSNTFGSDTANMMVQVMECDGQLTAPFAESFENGVGCWGLMDLDGDGRMFEQLSERLEAIGYGQLVGNYVHSGSDAVVSWSYYPYSNSLFGIDGDPLAARDVLVSPAIVLGEGAWKMGFYAMSFGGSEFADSVEVRLALTQPTSEADFTEVLMAKTAVEQEGYKQYIIDLGAYAGQTIYVGFLHESADKFGLIIDDVVVDHEVLGVEAAEADMVKVYPNPTRGRVVVQAEGVRSVEVLDMNGRVVKRCEGVNVVDMSTLANGVYVVRALTDKGVAVGKIVKK